MRATSIALVSAVAGALLVPAVPLAADQPSTPTAAIESASGSVPAGTAIKLDSSHSTGAIVRHLWDLDGNGSFETDSGATAIVEARPQQPGPLTVHVKVVDDQGQSAEAALDLTVGPAPRMVAGGPAPASPADPTTPKAHSGPGPGAPAPRATHAPAAAPAPPPAQGSGSAAPPAPSMAAPVMVAANRLATTAPARRSTSAVHKAAVHRAASVHAAGSSGVTIKNFAFAPGSVSVHVGDTITWTNQDPAPHTATAKDGSFDTGILQKGKSGSHTFTSAGTISYMCSVHPNMHGTVVVAAAAATGSGGSGNSGSATPAATATPSSTGGLPQTGLNLAAVVLVAVVLMGSGTVLRRRVGDQP